MSDTILSGDFTVYYAAENNQKRIEWSGSAIGTRTLNELYSAIQSLFDDSAQMDDTVPIRADTPDIYRMINEWFIDDTTVEHLMSGAIFSAGWIAGSTEHVLLIDIDNATPLEAIDIGRTIEGLTTGDSGTLLDFNATRTKAWIRPDDPTSGGDEFDNASEAYQIFRDAWDHCLVEDNSLGPPFTVRTTEINNATVNDVGFPAGAGANDAIYFGFGQLFSMLRINVGTAGTGTYTLTWEYSTGGDTWSALAGISDGTTDFKTSGSNNVTYTVPTDWVTDTIDGAGPVFWVRARRDGGTVTLDPALTQGFSTGVGAGNFTTASVAGESSWSGITTIGTIEVNTHLYINQDNPDTAGFQDSNLVVATKSTTDWWNDGQIDILLKTEEANVIIGENPTVPGVALATFLARQATKLYDNFVAALAPGGNTVVPFSTADDLNNTVGNREMIFTDSAGAFLVGEVITDDDDSTIEGVVTSVSGTNPTVTIQYYLIGDPLNDFTGATGTLSSEGTGTATAVAPTSVGPAASPSTTITVTHTAIDRDLGNGAGLRPYSSEIDAQAIVVQTVYQHLQHITRRGDVATAKTDGQEGQFFLGNELQIEYDTQTGDFAEGLEVTGGTSGAQGIIVADHDDGADGDLILRSVRGTFQVAEIITDTATGSATVAASGLRVITPVKQAPFGTFAGGVFFGAPGVFITDVAPGDEQAFQLIDDNGATQIPPNVVSVAVTNLISGDQVSIFEIVGPSDATVVKNQHISAAGNNAGDADFVVQSAIPADTPPSGKLRVRDVATGRDDRYRYSSFTASTFTLATASTGTADGGSDSDTLFDAAADFVTDGVEVGDLVRNTTESVFVRVTAVTDLNTLETEPVGDWNGDSYEVNTLVVNYQDGVDTAYVPLIDRVADAAVESNTLTFSTAIDVIVRVRNAGVILPFEQISQVTAGGLSVPAIRNPDDIFT